MVRCKSSRLLLIRFMNGIPKVIGLHIRDLFPDMKVKSPLFGDTDLIIGFIPTHMDFIRLTLKPEKFAIVLRWLKLQTVLICVGCKMI